MVKPCKTTINTDFYYERIIIYLTPIYLYYLLDYCKKPYTIQIAFLFAMNNIRAHTRQRGFTLVEMMVGLTLLGVFMTGIFGSVRLSNVLAESNIYQLSANVAAQGYLEQIKSLPYEDVLLASQDPANFSLDMISPEYESSSTVNIVDDPISLASSSMPIEKEILIDLRNNDTHVKMPVRMWITVEDKNTGSSPINALEIKIKYDYKMAETLGGNWMTGQVQAIRARI